MPEEQLWEINRENGLLAGCGDANMTPLVDPGLVDSAGAAQFELWGWIREGVPSAEVVAVVAL